MTMSFLTAASTVGAGAALRDGGVLALVGMGVVFAALILLWLSVEALSRGLTAPRSSTRVASPPVARLSADRGVIDAPTLAVLAAAVAAVLGPRARIRRVQRLSRNPTSIWTEHGRVVVQSSHRGQR